MTYQMTEEEAEQAAHALVMWFKSQEIDPGQALPVLIKAIVTAVIGCVISKIHNGETTTVKEARDDILEGLNLASDLLKNSFEPTDITQEFLKREFKL